MMKNNTTEQYAIDASLSNLLSKRVVSERFIFLLLLCLDISIFILSYFISSYARFQSINPISIFDFVFIAYISTTLLMFYILDLYQSPRQRSVFGFVARVGFSNILSSIFVIPVIYFIAGAETLQGSLIGRGILLINFGVFTTFALLYRLIIAKWYKDRSEKFNFLLIGKKDILAAFQKEYEQKSSFFGKSIFVVPTEEIQTALNLKNVFSWDQLDMLFTKTWSQVVIADNTILPNDISYKLMQRRLSGQNFVDLTDFYEKFWNKVPLFYLNNQWFLNTKGFRLVYSQTNKRIKRVSDLFFSTLVLIFALPLLVFISGLILLFGGKGPIFYKQKRIGEKGKEFEIYKFRTMVNNADQIGSHYTHKGDSRITKIGKILRLSRLDELPQLLNVLKGEMNLIGPRPEAASIDLDLQKKVPYYHIKHILKPGITGWTQIYCENGSTLENSIERLQYDIYYLKNYSVIMDFKIVFETAKVMLFGRGSR